MARGEVGAPLPLTGRYAVQGAQVRAGLELWARHTGARLVLLDDCSDPRQAARLHEDLDAGGCRFVLGPYGSDSTRAVARARAGRVVWNHGAAADDVQRLPGVVSVPSPASRYLVALGRAVARLSPGAHVAVEGAPGRFACEELQREAAVLGLRLVPKPTKADAVLYCGPLEWELARFRLREPGLLLGGVSPGLAAFAQLLGDDPEGPLAPVQWHPDLRVESELGPVTGSRSTSPPRPTQLASSPSAVSSSNPRTRSPSRGVSARPRSSAASNSVRTASRWGITSRPSSGAGAAASFCSRTPSGSAGDSQEGVALLRSDDGPERVGERIPGRGASVFARDHLVDPPQPCHGVREADCREGEQADVADLFGGHVLGQRPASVRPYGALCLRADRHPELDEAGAASIERAALVAGLRQPLVGDVDVRKARSKCW